MKTKRIFIDKDNIDKELIEEAGRIIKEGGLVAFPTETVYGLGGDALNSFSSEKIYKAKGRPSDNPLIVHIASMEALDPITEDIPENAIKLSRAFWPGPMTLVFRKSERVPSETTGGLSTVAVRMPDNKVALSFIEASGGYIAAPSANRSGKPSPTSADRVMEDMDGIIDMVIDGGRSAIGLESTIIDVTEEIPMILRPGYINGEMIKRVTGSVSYDPAVFGKEEPGQKPKAPGMRYRHYAPRGQLVIVKGEKARVLSYMKGELEKCREKGISCGLMVCDLKDTVKDFEASCDLLFDMGSFEREEEIAANLYEALRSFDDRNIEKIYSMEFYTPKLGQAIMNRLIKAAGHMVIELGSD
ncbi:MAG: threonylcarbamoyl-AMP synthase [Lachnospiraceae bacterium]|nr:threonylcarbamoyl-AMP synthase [Lachnospiraceae bacterium]